MTEPIQKLALLEGKRGRATSTSSSNSLAKKGLQISGVDGMLRVYLRELRQWHRVIVLLHSSKLNSASLLARYQFSYPHQSWSREIPTQISTCLNRHPDSSLPYASIQAAHFPRPVTGCRDQTQSPGPDGRNERNVRRAREAETVIYWPALASQQQLNPSHLVHSQCPLMADLGGKRIASQNKKITTI